MTQDTKREQEIAALFQQAGDAAKAALTSARDACSRQAKIILDLQGQIANVSADTVDDTTLASWTDTVNQAVAQAAKIQAGFDQIGVPGTVTPPDIPGYNPPIAAHPEHPIAGVPLPEPVKGKGQSGSQQGKR